MKKIFCTTSISDKTSFSISICENFGWIEPVFLLISPNLKESLHLKDDILSLLRVEHFEIREMNSNYYELHFFNSCDNAIKKQSPIILKAQYIGKETRNSISYSTFSYSYHFKEKSKYLEYCFFFIAGGISYLTCPFAFDVDDY